MTKENFTIRLCLTRKEKLKLYAEKNNKTMKQVVEDLIDKLKIDEYTLDQLLEGMGEEHLGGWQRFVNFTPISPSNLL